MFITCSHCGWGGLGCSSFFGAFICILPLSACQGKIQILRMHVNAKCKEDQVKMFSVCVNDRLFGWTLVIFVPRPTSTRAEMLVDEWLTDRARWPPKACVLIIEPQPPQHSSFLQIVAEKGRFSLSASECCVGCERKWCTAKEKNQQYSFMSMLLYIDYFVQNVYQACAYNEINFTTNMIQYNFDVNVLGSKCNFLFLFFIILRYWLR